MANKKSSKKTSTEGKVALAKAQSYSSMCWLGLLMVILTYVFFGMTCGKVNEARAYGLSSADEKRAQEIRASARNVMLLITGLWIFAIAMICVISANSGPAIKVRYGY